MAGVAGGGSVALARPRSKPIPKVFQHTRARTPTLQPYVDNPRGPAQEHSEVAGLAE
ncbi:hypothetical protein [Arthrobacter sp. DR-2P]|nr:hypothetical protein [Arthrobacter sp. DR-2P]